MKNVVDKIFYDQITGNYDVSNERFGVQSVTI